jgi:two-component system chemotaxis response regulator CheY
LARKILLADDSVTAQNMGRKILADAGYEVITVNNGSAALKKIAEMKPDLVILDVYMPGYSGLEVCQRLKESQETARIPVLLSVGKLEPFKPEEAQRVRADGFIVKPFEASELLSALSKLEDKVVPRSEPSKPGRFARAMAAAEEADRFSEPTAENGWKSRIGFPRKKLEPEEKVSEDETIYNPINRDLRTVMETALEKEAQSTQRPATENTVDVAAVAPAGFPNGVTPEEVAAIAAAAAQIQIASAVAHDREEQASEFQVTETPASQMPAPEIASPANPAPEPAASSPSSALDVQATSPVAASADAKEENHSNIEEKIENKAEAKIEERVEAALEAKQEEKTVEAQRESQDVPVTMAAASESVVAANSASSRWTAVAVALDGEEAAISLDQEMQKAYAAFVAAEMPSVAEPAPAAPVASAVNSFVSTPAAEAAPIPGAESEPPVPVEVTSQPIEAPAAVSAAAETKVDDSLPAGEPPIAEIAAAIPEVVPDLEAVKSSAAAWANWSHTHDPGVNATAAAEARPAEFEAPVPNHEDSAAMAVAAGAEHIAQEVPEPSPENPSDVASIVDSVLADLRPRLMAEISRKMSQKK